VPKRTLAVLTALIVGLALAPRSAVAQEGDTSTAHPRSGFWFNGGLGWGSLGCDGCTGREGGGVLSLAVGGSLSQNVLLGASIDGWSKEENGTRLTASSLLATARFYPSTDNGFFLRGGLGLGTVETSISGVGSGSETGAGALLGLGYDFRIGESVSLTPYLNGVGISEDTGSVNFSQLGLSVTVH